MDYFSDFLKALLITTRCSNVAESINPVDRGELGNDIILRNLDLPNNTLNYGQLYRNGIKLNENIFRIGGLCTGFNDNPYCMLIYYGNTTSKLKDCRDINSIGFHCIIDTNGDIKLQAKNEFYSKLYYLKGCIAVDNDLYYDLETGKVIAKGNTRIESTKYLFVENKYNWGTDKNKYPIGVTMIDWETGICKHFK